MPGNYGEETAVGLLELYPAPEGADVVSKMQGTGGPHPAQNRFLAMLTHGNDTQKKITARIKYCKGLMIRSRKPTDIRMITIRKPYGLSRE